MKGHTNNPNGRPARTVAQMQAYLLSMSRLSANGCLEWQGKLNQWGYGQIGWHGKHTMTHRVAAAIWMGFSLDDPRKVLHKCDNPKCIHPGHLWFGNDKDNSHDCTDKKRQYQQRKTHCVNGHEFSPENTVLKFPRGAYGPERRCRTCHNEGARRQRQKAKCALQQEQLTTS